MAELKSLTLDGKKYDSFIDQGARDAIGTLIGNMPDVPDDDHINGLINTALGVIENGTY